MELAIMNRRSFLKDTSSVISLGCAACIAACSKNSTEPATANQSFTIDLSMHLIAINDVIVRNNVRIVRINSGNTISSFTAVDQYCTHAGGNLNWVSANNIFSCPVHGSQFMQDGTLIIGSGPAGKSLKKYALSISGNILTVVI